MDSNYIVRKLRKYQTHQSSDFVLQSTKRGYEAPAKLQQILIASELTFWQRCFCRPRVTIPLPTGHSDWGVEM